MEPYATSGSNISTTSLLHEPTEGTLSRIKRRATNFLFGRSQNPSSYENKGFEKELTERNVRRPEDKKIDSPEILFSQLENAIREKNRGRVKSLLLKGAPVNMLNTNKQSPVYIASTIPNPDLQILEAILQHGADTRGNDMCNSPVSKIIKSGGDAELVKFLLAHGASTKNDTHNSGALYYAVEFKRPDIVKILLEPDTNINTDDFSIKVFEMAMKEDNTEILNIFLDHVSENFTNTTIANNLFKAAVSCKRLDIVKKLLDDKKISASLSICNSDACKFLASYVKNNNIEMVKTFIENKDVLDIWNKDFNSMLSLAKEYDFYEIVSILEKNGAKVNIRYDRGHYSRKVTEKDSSSKKVKPMENTEVSKTFVGEKKSTQSRKPRQQKQKTSEKGGMMHQLKEGSAYYAIEEDSVHQATKENSAYYAIEEDSVHRAMKENSAIGALTGFFSG